MTSSLRAGGSYVQRRAEFDELSGISSAWMIKFANFGGDYVDGWFPWRGEWVTPDDCIATDPGTVIITALDELELT